MKRKSLKDKCTEAFLLSVQVTETTKHDVFFYYSGHTQGLDVHIHVNGWVSGADPAESFHLYLSDGFKLDAHKILDKIINRLKSLQP